MLHWSVANGTKLNIVFQVNIFLWEVGENDKRALKLVLCFSFFFLRKNNNNKKTKEEAEKQRLSCRKEQSSDHSILLTSYFCIRSVNHIINYNYLYDYVFDVFRCVPYMFFLSPLMKFFFFFLLKSYEVPTFLQLKTNTKEKNAQRICNPVQASYLLFLGEKLFPLKVLLDQRKESQLKRSKLQS